MGKKRRSRPRNPNSWLRKKVPCSMSLYPTGRELKHIQRIQSYRYYESLTSNGATRGVQLPRCLQPAIRTHNMPGARQTKTVWFTGFSRRK